MDGLVKRVNSRTGRVAIGLLLFVVVSAASYYTVHGDVKLGVWEDHFLIGQNLRTSGSLSIYDRPSIFRPPGYPVFVALTLIISDLASEIGNVKPVADGRSDNRDVQAVLVAHCILIGIIAVTAYVTTLLWCKTLNAVLVGVVTAFNPFLLTLATLISYHLLLITFIGFSVLGTILVLTRYSGVVVSSAVGILWGSTCLIKPVVIPVTLFVVLFFVVVGRRRYVGTSGAMLFCFAVVLSVYVARNYLQTGNALITAQGGFALWGTSVALIQPGSPFLVWQPLWWEQGMVVFERITQSAKYSNELLNLHAAELNEAFLLESLSNIVRSPGTYAYNIAHNFLYFNFDLMNFWLKRFFAQNDFSQGAGYFLSIIFIGAQIFLGIVALFVGVRDRDKVIWLLFGIYLLIVVGHSISYATELYTCSKLPVILLGLPLFLRLQFVRDRDSISVSVSAFMLLLALFSTAFVFYIR